MRKKKKVSVKPLPEPETEKPPNSSKILPILLYHFSPLVDQTTASVESLEYEESRDQLYH